MSDGNTPDVVPGDGPHEDLHTRDFVVAQLHLDPEFAEKLWTAFGFPRASGHGAEFSDDDLRALSPFTDKSDAIAQGGQLAAARAIGQAMARLAEWQAEQIHALASDPDVGLTTEEMIGVVGRLQDLVWRRHLNINLERAKAHDEETARAAKSSITGEDEDGSGDSSEALGDEVIVGFADIVGYTAMSRRLRLTELEDLLEAFESAAQDIITAHGGAVIKSIGDAVMFTSPTPTDAAAVAVELHALSKDGYLPKLCIGIAHGIALSRMGDLFGEPVNIAARLASAARSGTTLVDEHLSNELRDDPDLHLSRVPTLSVRGYRRLKSHAVSPSRKARKERSSSERSEDSDDAGSDD